MERRNPQHHYAPQKDVHVCRGLQARTHRSARGCFFFERVTDAVHTKAIHTINYPGLHKVDLPLVKVLDDPGLYSPIVLDTIL